MKEIKPTIILIIIIIILFIPSILLIKYQKPKNTYAVPENFIEITDVDNNLYYDINTKIVYIIFTNTGTYQGFGFMSPYYAPNGLPYKYIDNKLIEIKNSQSSIN